MTKTELRINLTNLTIYSANAGNIHLAWLFVNELIMMLKDGDFD